MEYEIDGGRDEMDGRKDEMDPGATHHIHRRKG